MLRRAVVVSSQAVTGALQTLQATAGDDVWDEVEHAEPYGLATVPPPGATAIIGTIGADASHPVALAVAGGAARPTALAAGDVVLYDATGQEVRLSALGVQLGGVPAVLGVARATDPVQVTIPAGALGGGIPAAPVVVTGTIVSGSTTVLAAD